MNGYVLDEEAESRIISLTCALYRVAELLPSDPLRRKLCEAADEIFEAMIAENLRGLEGKTRKLMGYLRIAETTDGVNPVNFTVLMREYRALAGLLQEKTPARLAVEDIEIEVEDIEEDIEKEKDAGKKEIKKIASSGSNAAMPRPITVPANESGMRERQRTILTRIAELKEASVSDFYEVFKGISSKTIQRDLQDLTARNLIKKGGEKRWTIYKCL